jgi:hypothetical protein
MICVFFNNEEREEGEDKEEKLKSAAKDALAAFLVGGSDNLSFASTAEEVAFYYLCDYFSLLMPYWLQSTFHL